LKIAILGTRGIPASYGGFETFAEQLAGRLVERGHAVTVYGRTSYIAGKPRTHRGARLVLLPTVMHKYLDTPAHTALSTLHALFRRFDVLLYCNSANAFCTPWPRAFGKKVALNVDGLEWRRAKWNRFGKAVYRLSEYLSTFLPDAVVTDARVVQRYYRETFRRDSVYIPYGTPVGRVDTDAALRRFGLGRRRYLLYVSRLEPENNALAVIRAFETVRTTMRLVIVGDAPFATDYIRRLKQTADPRILFTGYVFGEAYRELQSHAYLYVQATEVGGTHPALLEAMGHGNCILANDVPEHREALGNAGDYFSAEDPATLAAKMRWMLAHPADAERRRRSAMERAAERYSWDKVAGDYETLFLKLKGVRWQRSR
jgi:glycosyltransferase involved in cell wall biosynthesis